MSISLRALGAFSAPMVLPAMFVVAAPAHATTIPSPPTKTLPSALDIAPPYQPGTRCLTTALPGPLDFARLLNVHYGTHTYGILRPCAAEHGEGRALDWMVNANTADGLALGNAITTWLTAKDSQGRVGAIARRLGINYIIWNHKMWRSYDPARGWAAYTGSSPHTDHIHMSFTWDGAYEQTSWWTGVALLNVRYTGPVGDPSSPVVVTTPVITNSGYPLLTEGASGADVVLAQKVIGTTPDGDFGPGTLAALKAWQSSQGIAVTGELDNDTWLRMVELGLVPSRASASPLNQYVTTVLRVGSSGPAVVALQKALGGLVADGAFGPLTEARVKAYQASNGLAVTGVVTAPTWQALMGVSPEPAPTPTPTPTPPPPPAPTPTPTPPSSSTPGQLIPRTAAKAAAIMPSVATEFTNVKGAILRTGSRGTTVEIAQRALGASVDGIFGVNTESMVRVFQKASGLPVTGIVDRASWDALELRAHPLVHYWGTVLRPGSTGDGVVAVQHALGMTADGIYGDSTIAAVKAAQAKAKLAQTGYVATLTWKAIEAQMT